MGELPEHGGSYDSTCTGGQCSAVIDRLAAMVSNSPVTSTFIAFVILAGSCGGLLLTVGFRHHLPSHHEEKGTRELLKVAVGSH